MEDERSQEPASEKRLFNTEDLSAQDANEELRVAVPGRYQATEQETHRSLKGRQISMIAIGGAIGEPSPA